MKKAILALCLLSAYLYAGWEFNTETRATDQKGNVAQKMIVKSTVEGENGKFVFEEATGSPMTPTGTYLLTQDGGQTMYLVDPINHTYSPFNLNDLMKLAGNILNMAQGVIKMEFSDPVIEVLEEGNGDAISGLATQYRKTKTTYEMNMKIMGMSRPMDIETIQESWNTSKLGDTAFGAWLRNDPAPTGNEDLDRLIRSQMDQVKGYPLKMIQTTTTTTWNKKRTKVKDKSVTQSQTVVTHLEKKSFHKEDFQIPDGYVMNEGQQEEGGLGSLKNLFKGKN